MKAIIKNILIKSGFKIRRQHSNQKASVVSLKPDSTPKGNVLLSYIIDPFLLQPGQPISYSHTNHWTSLQMAKTFLDLGFCVDVISYENSTFIPQKDYAFFIDVRWNLERLAPLLNKDCIKIMHIDLCHILYNNMAESRRLLELQQRRGFTIRPRRFEYPNLAIENADYATILGNEFTSNTFSYANKPIYRLPNAHPFLYPWPQDKNFEACCKNFLWFGSNGFVRKGLDLVLDVFSEMPEHNLTVCGPIQKDKDFEKVYYKELYQTTNIHTIGWVDINSPEFIKITDKCIGLIFPSCAEGQSGGVINCIHAGLVPILSYESGVDVDEFGVILKDCSIHTIKNTIRMVSDLPTDKLLQKAKKAWKYARANHTREKFAEEYRKVIEKC